jgi:hypothetical protein
MTEDQWFDYALKLRRTQVTFPRIFSSVAMEARYHRRRHGEEDGLRWCGVCQCFMDKDDKWFDHPHILAGYSHEFECWQCVAYEIFLHRFQDHVAEHARQVGWYECGDCWGWYALDGEEDQHETHGWGIFQAECTVCQGWEGQAKHLLEVRLVS